MAPQPNVILIVSDDHGYADRSALGIDADVRTPALDRLAAEGVSCAEAYVTAPVCSPSRSGLISGQYQARWGVHWFADSHFPDHLPSLAEQFSELGYTTGYLGKVHYGPEKPGDRATPPHHGFDVSYYGLAGQQMGRLNYLRHSEAAVAEYGEFGARVSAVQPMLEGDEPVELEGFLTDELGRRSREFVTECADTEQPFFLMLAFNAVHNFCWQLPVEELQRRGLPTWADYDGDEESYLDWYDGQVSPRMDHGRDYYLAQLELMDTQIGHLLTTLDDHGLGQDTIVVYLTDNGGSNCNFARNDPLRGTKYTLWEGGIRVPMLVRWLAGAIPAGQVRSGPVSSLDLYPTLLAAAGADPGFTSHCDGVDQLALLRGDAVGGHDELHWDNGFQWAIRVGGWKLIWVDGDDPLTQGLRVVEKVEPGRGYQLFDLTCDPGEANDLSDREPDIVARLLARHEAWRDRVRLESPLSRSWPRELPT